MGKTSRKRKFHVAVATSAVPSGSTATPSALSNRYFTSHGRANRLRRTIMSSYSGASGFDNEPTTADSMAGQEYMSQVDEPFDFQDSNPDYDPPLAMDNLGGIKIKKSKTDSTVRYHSSFINKILNVM